MIRPQDTPTRVFYVLEVDDEHGPWWHGPLATRGSAEKRMETEKANATELVRRQRTYEIVEFELEQV